MFMLTAGRSRLRRTRGTKILICLSCACRHYRLLVLVLVLWASSLPRLVRMAWRKPGLSRDKFTSLYIASSPRKSIFLSAGIQKAQECVQRRLALTKHFDIFICAYPDNACIDLFLITLGQLCVQFMCSGEILTRW